MDIATRGEKRLEPLTGVQVGRDLLGVEEGAEFGVVVKEQQAQQMGRGAVGSAVAGNVFRLKGKRGEMEGSWEIFKVHRGQIGQQEDVLNRVLEVEAVPSGSCFQIYRWVG